MILSLEGLLLLYYTSLTELLEIGIQRGKQLLKMDLIQIPLIVPPVSHKEIRRILGWLLLPLSSSLVPT